MLRRSKNRSIAGVCGGFANYFGGDPTFWRLGAVLFTLAGGAGIVIYLVCWLVIPNE